MVGIVGTYATRSQVARQARRQNIECFHSVRLPNLGWRLINMEARSPTFGDALAYARTVDFVSHVEVMHIDGGRQPGLRSVLVVTCRKDELPEGVPFDVEPVTPSLWDDGAADHFEHRARSTTSAGPRAKSDVESPTKLVWRLADEMPGADRKAVIDACVAAGVNKSTAQTQYYKWSKAQS